MKIRPRNDLVLVKASKTEEKTVTGLYIPASAQQAENTGEVVAVGPGKVLSNGTVVPVDVKVGDKVVYAPFKGVQVDVEGVAHMFMKEDSILAVLHTSSKK